MAYESNVALMLNENDYQALKNKFEKLSTECRVWLTVAEKRGERNFNRDREHDEFVYLYWEDIKWSEKLPEVKAVMDQIREMQNQNHAYDFVRLGDDEEDMEHRYNIECTFEIKRSIAKF